MKSSILKLSFMALALCMILSSCIEEPANRTFLTPDGAYPYIEAQNGGFYNLTDIANAVVSMDVNTSTSGEESVSSIDVMKSFNGGEPVLHSTISGSQGSVSIPCADAVSGLGVTTGDLALGDVFTYSFMLNTSGGRRLGSAVSVDIPMSCPSELGGMYDRTTTYHQHDFLPDYGTNTDVAEVRDLGDGIYEVDDFSGGLFGVGPYVDNYGTSGFLAQFQDVCNNINLLTPTDPWQTYTPVAGMDNAVDPGTGIITISAVGGVYGESWTSVYTPQ